VRLITYTLDPMRREDRRRENIMRLLSEEKYGKILELARDEGRAQAWELVHNFWKNQPKTSTEKRNLLRAILIEMAPDYAYVEEAKPRNPSGMKDK
jgi:hypothetical protein